jgi:seryl-tRNA synthetase
MKEINDFLECYHNNNPNDWLYDKRDTIASLIKQYADQQTTSLKAEVESLQSQLAKAEADKVELLKQLKECTLQIEYLHDKFPKTGTSSSIILKANQLINKHGNNK